MATEILNIDYHRKELIIKALNRNRNFTDAAAALGISKRTLQRQKQTYNIKKSGNQYQIIDQKRKKK